MNYLFRAQVLDHTSENLGSGVIRQSMNQGFLKDIESYGVPEMTPKGKSFHESP